jgi:hypothetical protein
MGFFEKFFHRSPPVISEEAAVLIARQACERLHWFWSEPLNITSRGGTWVIKTNTNSRGANARFVIDQQTGNVIEATFAPR